MQLNGKVKFWGRAAVPCGIACCHARFGVRLLWQLQRSVLRGPFANRLPVGVAYFGNGKSCML